MNLLTGRSPTNKPTAMDLVPVSRFAVVTARLLVFMIALTSIALVITPWQQSVPAEGRVIAFAPDDRQQNIEAPIEGRIGTWYVREGSPVKKGDPIVDLVDNDPEFVARLRQERDAIARRLDSARTAALSMESRLDSLTSARTASISAAESRIMMAKDRVAAAEQDVELAQATLEIAELNSERQGGLKQEGLASARDDELAKLDRTRAATGLERAKVALAAARSEAAALQSDLEKVRGEASASVESGEASQSSAEMEVAKTSAELARIEVRLARQSAQSIVAPRDGTVLKVVANGGSGQIVKPGQILAVIVPNTKDRAVEMWVRGNDIPLVREGAAARVQFEGWPALQFSGWPSVAVGTFGGKISLIDSTDDGQGRFRVMVVPAEGESWPSSTYLRQGVRVQGWVQLGRVPLGFELWRQFNGFPPSLSAPPEGAGVKDGKEKGK